MSRKRPNRIPPTPRKTLSLLSTVRSTQVGLDHSSDIGLEYLIAWLTHHGSPQPPAGGVIRRALALYVDRLSSPAVDVRDEVRQIHHACTVLPVSPGHRRDSTTRLEEAQKGIKASTAFPSWSDIYSGPGAAQRREEFDSRVDVLVRSIRPSARRQHPPGNLRPPVAP